MTLASAPAPPSGARPMRELIRALLDALDLRFPRFVCFPEFPTEDDVP